MHIKKRLVALLMASVMMFTMIGCSDSKKSDETEDVEETEETEVDIEQAAVGTWVCEYQVPEYTLSESERRLGGIDESGHDLTVTFELYENGGGRKCSEDNTSGDSMQPVSFDWEYEGDNLIRLELHYATVDTYEYLEYNMEDDTISYEDWRDGVLIFSREE